MNPRFSSLASKHLESRFLAPSSFGPNLSSTDSKKAYLLTYFAGAHIERNVPAADKCFGHPTSRPGCIKLAPPLWNEQLLHLLDAGYATFSLESRSLSGSLRGRCRPGIQRSGFPNCRCCCGCNCFCVDVVVNGA